MSCPNRYCLKHLMCSAICIKAPLESRDLLFSVGCFIFMGHFPAMAAVLAVQGHCHAVDSAPAHSISARGLGGETKRPSRGTREARPRSLDDPTTDSLSAGSYFIQCNCRLFRMIMPSMARYCRSIYRVVNISARFREWLAEILCNSAILGWAEKHFEGDWPETGPLKIGRCFAPRCNAVNFLPQIFLSF